MNIREFTFNLCSCYLLFELDTSEHYYKHFRTLGRYYLEIESKIVYQN